MTNTEFRSRIASLATLDDLELRTINDEWVSFAVNTPQGPEPIYVHPIPLTAGNDVIIEFMSSGLTLGKLPQHLLNALGREFIERNALTYFALWAFGTDVDGHYTLRPLSRISGRRLDLTRFRRVIGALLTECAFLRERSAANGAPVIRPLSAGPSWRK